MSPLVLIGGGHPTDNSFNDPLLPHLLEAIGQCDNGSRIDLCVSFIRQSGLMLLRDALHQALARGAHLRIITSDYLDVTQPLALRELLKFDPARTTALIYQSQGNRGFHLKSYLFIQHARSGAIGGQAFVGSSNVSAAALSDSLEWNWSLKVTPQGCSQAAESLQQLADQVETLAQDPRVVTLTHNWIDGYLERYQKSTLREFRALTGDTRSNAEQLRETPVPNAVQLHALAALHASREMGHKRGVVVMATGLGKTWLAAFDIRQMQVARLLFVAHREEILTQARDTFLHMAPAARTGFYQGLQNDEADWLFASIQTLGKSNHLSRFPPDHFDYIVVDEFHHAASPSYRRLLDHFQPRFLLGLTATPDRTDQADILALCDNNLVYDCGLAEAIEQHLLVPLSYHGILDDTIDYTALPWRNGQFDPGALESAFASQKRARHALTHWRRLGQQRTLAFCISTRHADFMAAHFATAGVRALAIYAGSRQGRQWALEQLAEGQLDIIFSVDLFNEGTDLPAIDTVLMLRPTESRIVFLQQLGRGLRRHPGKERLIVIDLVGNHKACLFKPVLLEQQLSKGPVGTGKPMLVDGCFINLDPALLPILKLLKQPRKTAVLETYRALKEELGYRPTARQTWTAMQENGLSFDTRPYGGWFNLVAEEEELDEAMLAIVEAHRDFLYQGVETTALVKSFKIILLQALLEMDGLRHPPTLAALASHSRYLLERYPELARLDLPPQQQQLTADSPAWLRYWKNNPIKHSSGDNSGAKNRYWFEVKEEHFLPRLSLSDEEIELLHPMVQELLDLRLAQYLGRKQVADPEAGQMAENEDRGSKVPHDTGSAGTAPASAATEMAASDLEARIGALEETRAAANEEPLDEQTTIPVAPALPYFPNLRMACGHFKDGDSSDMEMMTLQGVWGALDPARYFLARASGNSMNGGKQPIQDGELLLLEWITPTNAGSISGNIMAIEHEDETGQTQYLLRVIRKNTEGAYQLKANNPDYPDLPASEQMRTFARFKAVVPGNER